MRMLAFLFFPGVVLASIQQDVLGTWHVEKVVCSSNNADQKFYDKIYFTFTIDGRFSSFNPGLTNDGMKDAKCASGEDTNYSVSYALDKNVLTLKSSIHKDTCGGKEHVVPARVADIFIDENGLLHQSLRNIKCDDGRGRRTWILKKITN